MEKIKSHIGFHHINTWKKFILISSLIIAGIFSTVFSVKAYPQIFNIEVSLEKITNIELNDPIVINFSTPMFVDDYIGKIKIIPQKNYKLRWENSNRRLKIFPENYWKPQESYQLILPEARNIMFNKTEKQILFFSTEKYPQIESIFPKNGDENVVIGAEDPITVNFNKSTSNFSLKFILNSKVQSNIQNNNEKTQFKFLPLGGVEDGVLYEFKVEAKYKDEEDSNYEEIFQSSFKTLPPAKIDWDKNFSIRIDQAKRYARAKIEIGKYIDINLSAQILSIFENGKIIDSFMISSGKSGMNTPKMETQVFNKFPRAYSNAYGLFMPYWMAIVKDGKFGIHELPEWPGGYKEGVNHLGIPVSHGCVRLGVGSAERVYNFAEIGTPIVIY